MRPHLTMGDQFKAMQLGSSLNRIALFVDPPSLLLGDSEDPYRISNLFKKTQNYRTKTVMNLQYFNPHRSGLEVVLRGY